MPLSQEDLSALKGRLDEAEKQAQQAQAAVEQAQTTFTQDYKILQASVEQVRGTKAEKKQEREKITRQMETLKAAMVALEARKEETLAAFQALRQEYDAALLEFKAEQEAEAARLAAEPAHQEQEPAAQRLQTASASGARETVAAPNSAMAAVSSEVPAASVAGQQQVKALEESRHDAQPITTVAASASFFPPAASAVSADMPLGDITTVHCPYEVGCSASVIPKAFKDPRIPPALILLLLWLIREAVYCTMRMKYESGGVTDWLSFSGTYVDQDFNDTLKAKKQTLKINQSLICSDLSKVNELLTRWFTEQHRQVPKKTEFYEVSNAFPDWLKLSDLLGEAFKETPLYFERLRYAMGEIFEWFLNPAKNSRHVNVEDLMTASAEKALVHPVCTFKLRMLYYIASLRLERGGDKLIEKKDFLNSLYESLRTSVHAKSFETRTSFSDLVGATKGFITQFSGLRASHDNGNSIWTATANVLASATKYVAGVQQQGNFGVVLQRLQEEMKSEGMAQRFATIVVEAAGPSPKPK